MVDTEFIYNQTKILLQCNLTDKMDEIFHKFTIKADKKQEDIFFLYNGVRIEGKLALNELISSENAQKNKIQILVYNINNENEEDEKECFKPSRNIICPNCKESIRISIHDYKIKIYEFQNKHIKDNIPFNQFENTQMINEKKIKCEKCKISNKNDTYENQFFRCLTCKINICPLCKNSHDKSHNIIDYEQKDFICDLHNEVYNSYCKDCLKNICVICESEGEHTDHNIISFGKIMPNIKALKEEINSQREKISQFINGIEEIINKLNNLIDNIEIFYKIYNNLISNYKAKNRNFNILQNIADIKNYNNDFYKTIMKINDEKNIVNKFSYLIDIYNQMNIGKNNSIDKSTEKEENILIRDTNFDKNKNDKTIKDNNNILDDKNEEISLPESNKDSVNIKDEKICNFDNFYITQLKLRDSYESKNEINIIYKLLDDRIALIDKEKFYVFNITDKINKVFSIFISDLKLGIIRSMIQLDDGNIILNEYDKMHLFKLSSKGIEKIESFQIESEKIFKLSKDKILAFNYPTIYLYSYENNKIIDQKHSFEISELNCKFDFVFQIFNGSTFTSVDDMFVINENEFFIFYSYYGIGNIYNRNCLFYNVKKKKSIDSIKLGTCNTSAYFSLYDKKNLFVSYNNKIFIIDLKKHSIQKRIPLENDGLSIISLNEKYILVVAKEKSEYFILKYEFEKKKNLKFTCKKKINGKYKFIEKCNGNNLIMKDDDNHKFVIYG